MTCLDFKVVTNVADRDGKAEIIGHTDDGPASVLFPAKDLPSIMASLSAIETELNAADPHRSVASFHYQGFETRTTADHGVAMLIIRCHPDVRFAFLLSSAQLLELGEGCLKGAKSTNLQHGRRPN